MTSTTARFVAGFVSLTTDIAVLAALVLGGCGTAPPPAEAVPGIAAGTEGLVEVVVLDLDSRAPLPGASVTRLVLSGPDEAGTTDARGFVAFTRDTTSAFGLDVSASGHVPVRWTGVTGGRVVVPLRATVAREPFEVDVTGLGTDEQAVVSVTTRPALLQPSSVRLAGTSGSALAACTSGAAGSCTAVLDTDAAPSGRLVLVAVTDGAGAARRLVRFDGVVTGASLELGAGEDLALETLVASVPSVPAGLTAVVGVPGISFGSAVGVLGFSVEGTSPALPLPVVTGMLATRWALFVARGEEAGVPDETRRSVLVDRRAETSLGPWTSWLAPPDLDGTGEALGLVPSAGATVHAIDWLSGDEAVLRTDMILDASLPLETPAGATGARVRALDTDASPAALVLDTAERATTRFAERDVATLP